MERPATTIILTSNTTGTRETWVLTDQTSDETVYQRRDSKLLDLRDLEKRASRQRCGIAYMYYESSTQPDTKVQK